MDAFSGLGTTFLLIEHESSHILYYLEGEAEDLKELGTFPIDKNTNSTCSGAFDNESQTGIISRSTDLLLIRRKELKYSCERIVPKLPDNALIQGIACTEQGNFISVVPSPLADGSIIGNSLMNIQILKSTGNDSGLVTTKLHGLNANTIIELHNCHVLGPVIIGRNKYCFTAGMNFFIFSGDNPEPIYRKNVLAPDILLTDENYIITSRFYDGNLFALPLIRPE